MAQLQNCASPLLLWLPSTVTDSPGRPSESPTVRLPPAITAWFGARIVTVWVSGELGTFCASTTIRVTVCDPSASVTDRNGLWPD
jgi:hypothetical protein